MLTQRCCFFLLYLLLSWALGAKARHPPQRALGEPVDSENLNRTVSTKLFHELEELARIVDISYCVGTTGIQKPFLCASRCQDFEGFELITTWNTGPLLADSCGYIAVSHPPSPKRIIVAFRGTYSIANTIIDLSTVPQEYIPYPGDDDDSDGSESKSTLDSLGHPLRHARRVMASRERKCKDCTVHLGFMTSWRHTRKEIMPHLEAAIKQYPRYQLTLVGHSLGGAVAALAALDFKARRWNPKVTTFGEPRVGNEALMHYIDEAFIPKDRNESNSMFRRVTHVDDPIPLLPLEEWGFKMHAGEIYISKASLPPGVTDLQHCEGDDDPECIGSGVSSPTAGSEEEAQAWQKRSDLTEVWSENGDVLQVPPRFKLWQLFFAHRDYFWRLGLCIPGGDPWDWHRHYPTFEDRNEL